MDNKIVTDLTEQVLPVVIGGISIKEAVNVANDYNKAGLEIDFSTLTKEAKDKYMSAYIALKAMYDLVSDKVAKLEKANKSIVAYDLASSQMTFNVEATSPQGTCRFVPRVTTYTTVDTDQYKVDNGVSITSSDDCKSVIINYGTADRQFLRKPSVSVSKKKIAEAAAKDDSLKKYVSTYTTEQLEMDFSSTAIEKP